MKKKKAAILLGGLAVLVIAAIVVFVVRNNQNKHVVDRAVVLDVTEGIDGWYSILLFTEPSQNNTADLMTAGINADTKLVNAQGKPIEIADIQPGQQIELTHSGLIMESYPGQYAEVYRVKVLGPAEAGFYQQGKDRMNEWNSQFE